MKVLAATCGRKKAPTNKISDGTPPRPSMKRQPSSILANNPSTTPAKNSPLIKERKKEKKKKRNNNKQCLHVHQNSKTENK